MKFEIFAGPSLKISGGYYEISGGLSFTRAFAQTILFRVVTPRKTSFQALEAIVKENVFVYNMDGRKLFCVEAAATPNIDRCI